jgi:hypothetical protein
VIKNLIYKLKVQSSNFHNINIYTSYFPLSLKELNYKFKNNIKKIKSE